MFSGDVCLDYGEAVCRCIVPDLTPKPQAFALAG